MDPKHVILNYFKDCKMMQLATAKDGQPWVCNVWFAADGEGRIYWLSNISRRHSKEIIENPKVAGAMCLPQTPGTPGRGIQFSGTATKLTEQSDIDAALNVYAERFFPREQIIAMLGDAEKPQAFYRIDDVSYKLHDKVTFPSEPVQFWETSNQTPAG